MNKHDNFSVNFSLKGFTSILIGIYFFSAGYLIKNLLDGFLIDDHPMGMLSAEIIEYLIISIAFLVFLFSSLALYFSGKRSAKRFQFKLWNGKTKAAFWKYMVGILLIFIILLVLMQQGYIDYMTPTFLILYAFLLFLFKNRERKNLLILSGLCLLLAIMCILIPTYWSSSLSILGIAHVTYGVAVRN
ncbi:hypothetical protein MC378_11575 [Polaribacter sp. MSW13]|uniref:Uncharacterized protein n=1 Tax=Polaribacter marinus TaxID=2916838 RepID=A0A9X1VQ71_9FLAO|nr:hypothetical protein [Polaribacter marinus]MCI2229808.1 hypothetical protein [Polaribacter marinus]